MSNRFDDAAISARQLTNKQLADEIAAISNGLTRESIQDLLPTLKDKEAFIQLMQQVEADTAMDEKLAYLQDNIQSAGTIALKLLRVLV
jgi:uncharacterized protein YaaR (DUF327 family)